MATRGFEIVVPRRGCSRAIGRFRSSIEQAPAAHRVWGSGDGGERLAAIMDKKLQRRLRPRHAERFMGIGRERTAAIKRPIDQVKSALGAAEARSRHAAGERKRRSRARQAA